MNSAARKSAAVSVNGVSKTFVRKQNIVEFFIPSRPRERVPVLDRIDLSISEGEIVALTGPNGAGKTTLLKIIAGLILPDSGSAIKAGSYYYVPTQDRSFYERLTAKENLRFFAALRNLSSEEAMKRIAGVAELIGLDFLEARYQELSTGMKQKLSIARCLLMDPDILLMDEPWRGLDPGFTARLHADIKTYMRDNPKKIILYTTHIFSELPWADRRLNLENTKLTETRL